MSQSVALSPSRHYGKRWLKVADYLFAEHDTLVPVVGEELPHVLANMPMGFYKKDDGGFELVAIMSLEPGRNLFVHPEGHWVGGYKPAAYRGYPFQLRREAGTERYVLCFDEASGLLLNESVGDGEPFFDAEGELAPLVKQVLDFLTQRERQRKITQRAVDMLAGQALIVPWEINVPQECEDHTRAVDRVYRINEKALSSLGEKRVGNLTNRQCAVYCLRSAFFPTPNSRIGPTLSPACRFEA
ncbi:SapC family protein [Halomonas sp. ANAO-440]|uniref:SapC family protein n=1 Tax=Halomonas sp. ANAO-440 TaxID=2861360 RepID=UPI001CAA777F|nr:SapC family protein [Halomonas sp. ANAO-440]MBZ0332073.1 SapC family protein [Halomonas sp. ANAO-440]